MSKLNVKLPDASDSLHLKVPDTSDSVWVKLPTPPQIKKLTSGGDSLSNQSDTFLNYDVSDWSALPDADPMPLGQINSVAYNPAGTLLAVGRLTPPTLIIYNATTLTSIPGTPTPSVQIRKVVFNKAGTLIAYASGEKVFIYNVPDWTFVNELDLSEDVRSLDFNYADTLLAVGRDGFGSNLVIYDTTTWLPITGPAPVDEPEGWVYAVDFSPDDTMLAVGNWLGSTRNLTIYDTTTWAATIPDGVTTDGVTDCTFNNAQTELLVLKLSEPRFVRWDTSTWTILGGTPALEVQASGIAINEDDSYVAIAMNAGVPALRVYDASTWIEETLSPTPLDTRRMITVDFQPSFEA